LSTLRSSRERFDRFRSALLPPAYVSCRLLPSLQFHAATDFLALVPPRLTILHLHPSQNWLCSSSLSSLLPLCDGADRPPLFPASQGTSSSLVLLPPCLPRWAAEVTESTSSSPFVPFPPPLAFRFPSLTRTPSSRSPSRWSRSPSSSSSFPKPPTSRSRRWFVPLLPFSFLPSLTIPPFSGPPLPRQEPLVG
jgi:hypothetical protein